jgi:PHS family inorganic phosphate transporter-like MFS transporter
VTSLLDRRGSDGFKWKVWWVAASGFFTTSYSIFATNVINPALGYVYPTCVTGSSSSPVVTMTTLAGTVLGTLLFGYLADRYGRKSVYGFELSLVVVATIGMTTASTGFNNSMSVYGWIGFWRCLLGIGIGAEVRREFSSSVYNYDVD